MALVGLVPRAVFADPCLDDAFGGPTNCTANDFGIASVMMTAVTDDGCQHLGDTFTFDGELTAGGSKSARYDVGFFISSDALQARSGQCTDVTIPPGSTGNDDGDACGDYDGQPVHVPVSAVTVACEDGDGDGFFDFVVCAAWHQNPGSECAGPDEAVPGNAAKCNCQRVVTGQAVPPCQSNADCADEGNPCTDEVCNVPQSGVGDAAGCSHEPNTAPCDDGQFCNGTDTCAAGACRHEGNPCELCVATCDEETDSCDPSPDAGACTDLSICRGPRYWAQRGGFEGVEPVNVVQEVLDAAGGLQVCGRSVTSTSNAESPWLEGLGVGSALEALCVKPKNVKQRRLDRELVATALNCTISGRADCDAFVEPLVGVAPSACDDVCAGIDDGPGSPTPNRCVHALACFNDGGRIVDGECATGTCASEPQLYCGAEHGPCPDFDGQPQRCERFGDSCRSAALCNEALGVCPNRTDPSSRRACQEAMKDTCTVDWCPNP